MVSLTRRFFVVFALTIALPIVAVSLGLSQLYMGALLDTASGQSRELLEQLASASGTEINSVSVLAATVLYDPELREDTAGWLQAADAKQKFAAVSRINDRLSSIFTFSNRNGALSLYMSDGSVLAASNYASLHPQDPFEGPAYDRARAEPNHVVIADELSGPTKNGENRFLVSAIICPSAELGGDAVKAIVVTIRVPYLDQFLGPEQAAHPTGLVVLGRDSVLADFTGELSGSELASIRALSPGSHQVSLGDAHYLVNAQVLDAGWTFLLAMDTNAVTRRITAYQWYILPVLLVIITAFGVYSWLLYARVSKPIIEVVNNMRRFATGETLRPVEPQGIREISTLHETFLGMVNGLQRLEDERRDQSERRLAAEIRALQFQINPHFVANTLNSIRMMAMATRNTSIRDMTKALIEVLRYSYAHAGPFADVGSEIENLRNYLSIMKIRFGEHFDSRFDIAADTLGLQVPRLCLQPLVENAILHGFAGLKHHGELRIWSRRDLGVLLLGVEDNGQGMTVERLREVFEADSEPAEGERIGVRNVRDRLALNYGPEAAMQVTSAAGEGTKVLLRIPLGGGAA